MANASDIDMRAGWLFMVTTPGTPAVTRCYKVHEPDKAKVEELVRADSGESIVAVKQLDLQEFINDDIPVGGIRQHG